MFFQRAIEGCTIYKFYSVGDAAEQGDKKRRKGTGLAVDICKTTRERKQRHTEPCWHYTLQRKTCTSNVCAERVTFALSDSLDAAHAVVSIYCQTYTQSRARVRVIPHIVAREHQEFFGGKKLAPADANMTHQRVLRTAHALKLMYERKKCKIYWLMLLFRSRDTASATAAAAAAAASLRLGVISTAHKSSRGSCAAEAATAAAAAFSEGALHSSSNSDGTSSTLNSLFGLRIYIQVLRAIRIHIREGVIPRAAAGWNGASSRASHTSDMCSPREDNVRCNVRSFRSQKQQQQQRQRRHSWLAVQVQLP
ncbi:unnamed protein product [Trichogramma brassicae]|uniref:Uncharacterized protein n=1 Tax=Trichogramma brassicae TaxID=86971 RepID=A0A6H5J9V5_9HYME|nr:unnamed protein product [Trichogramma brassicae]